MSELTALIHKYCPKAIEYKTLGELGYFYGGLSGKTKEDFKDGNAKLITYMNVYTNPSLKIDVTDSILFGEYYEKSNIAVFSRYNHIFIICFVW